ncbi:hypothetical protein KKI24_27855, partial [bacterium]|nr:hypothetical protein [bacterium]
MVYSNIALNQIDSEDRLFYLHHLDTATLDWDGRHNLFNPIWLQEKRPRSYRIVDGFTVFQRAKAMEFPGPIPAQVFPENSSLPELWKLRVQKRKRENNLSCMAYLQGLASMMMMSNLTV